ncbi:aminoglycoside phosphotransferase family protein [Streptomyces luteocolor]|uniref:aminoglycoside phosphotransferase family protein n=1 Tax=Streptomyces luteocolor TaxID=285500 RepID=UPI000852CA67|nr:aminoglycoside phosphotransferase family protein [Streptomyces luteocolor]
MSTRPDAEDGTGIDENLVRSLLKDQYPHLSELDVHSAVRGWDNEMWRLGAESAVRIPRTDRAPELLRKEHRWLPALAPGLPLPVPTPLHLGEPTDRFPKPWTVAKWVPGEPADRTPISRPEDAADTLAAFLRALHAPAPADAPASATRGVPLGLHAAAVDAGLRDLAAEGIPPEARDVWHAALAAPRWEAPPRWLHGDLHPANVVVTDGTLSGVLDFGELCAGDPATDLAAAWLLLPEGAADRFFAAYGRVDEATVLRARGWAVCTSLGLLSVGRKGDQGLPGGKVTWGRAGRAALRRVTAR